MSDIKEIFKESIRKVVASINPGTADISGIGDGTLRGAIRELNGKIPGTIKRTSLIQKITAAWYVRKAKISHPSQTETKLLISFGI